MNNQLVRVSKALSYLLRHGAVKEGVPIRQDGYVLIEDVIKHLANTNIKVNLQMIRNVVNNNDKKRFEISEIEGQLYIRCVQGHTIEIDEQQLLEKIQNPLPVIYHGTNEAAWEIIKIQGLNKMARQHIHFAIGLPGEAGVISGMRHNVQVIVQVDMEKAMNAGIEFYISKNNVVLSSGINGVIAPQFFKAVFDKKGQNLLE